MDSEPSITDRDAFLTFVHVLFFIASTLLRHSEGSEYPRAEDVKSSIEYLQYLRRLPFDSFEFFTRNLVTTSLIEALAIQVKSEAGDGTQDIKEMVVLCRELFTSNAPADLPVDPFLSLSEAVHAEYIRGRAQSLGQAIECLRDAVEVCPKDFHGVMFALASLLVARFWETHSNDDYLEAISLLERILNPKQPGECPNSTRELASSLATALALIKSAIFPNPEYTEASISRLRTFLNSPSIPALENLRLVFTQTLALQAKGRSVQYNLAESIEEANSYATQAVDLSSTQSPEKSGKLFLESDAVRESYSMTRVVEKIRHLEALLSVSPPGTEHHNNCLIDLADWYESKFYCTKDISDIEDSIKYRRLSLDATHYVSEWRRVASLTSLRKTLLLAFQNTGKISYLNDTMTIDYDILKLKTQSARHVHLYVVQRLVRALLTREQLLGGQKDRQEAIRLIPMVIDNQYANEPDRFQVACQWALLARSVNHPTTSTAYETAMSLLQKSLSFAPTVSSQHARFVTMGENCHNMPLDYASHQIALRRFEEAVEILEKGRAVLWSEMRGFRAPAAQLIDGDSPLSKRCAEINQELEALTVSTSPSGRPEMEVGVAQGSGGTDPFGQLVVKRQKLVEERDALISQIQSRPGSKGFLKTPSFNTLCSAASRGPVILINHCKWRSDILILCHNYLIISVPTVENFYDRANKLRDELVEARKHGLDSDKYQDALCSVLKGLYELVGEPVIKRLRALSVPEQSRIWWCPTSVFCSLPLHAMGPIPSSDAFDQQYFSDLYIPSYTPSLSALIESRKASPHISEKPSLLLVAQPDHSLPGAKGEIKVIRKLKEQFTVTDLVSSEATPTSVVKGLQSSRFVHFACHGVLETGKPFEACFKLHEGERLTLLDIVRSRLPDAEFAFLSCCHAAEMTEESIADEALHLTAAMQYCGFRSVVGTMSEMTDTDGRDLVKSFYKSLFSSRETGVPYYERSAGALRDAVQKLRGKRGITLERWVNSVHYGA